MKIVIIGLGTIGRTILKSLSGEGHTITIIDENKDKVESLIERYDVFGVVGNGACVDIQREAKMKDADLAIVLTDSDELNIFACLVAKKIGVKSTVARVCNPEYRRQILEMKDELSKKKYNIKLIESNIETAELKGMLDELGIKNNVSPKDIVASRIISYIRAIANTRGSNVLTLYRLVNNQVEALEFYAKKHENLEKKFDIPTAFLDAPLSNRAKINHLIRGEVK